MKCNHMKKILSILLTLSVLCVFASTPLSQETTAEVQYVYICTGNYSTKYHSTNNCRGLNNCKSRIIKVSKRAAEETYHRTPCKICY